MGPDCFASLLGISIAGEGRGESLIRHRDGGGGEETGAGGGRQRLPGPASPRRARPRHRSPRRRFHPPQPSPAAAATRCAPFRPRLPRRPPLRRRPRGNLRVLWTVYEGVKSFYKEEDETLPVNMYGKSKVAAEKFIIEKCSNYAILRSSIIYGPQTVSPVAKSLPIQWMDSVLSQGQQVEFFNDEFRCPVYVKDMVDVILSLAKTWLSDGKKVQVLLNVGGPDRVSRLQMAESVATVRGNDHNIIKSVSASSVNRGVASPSDISMDITKLTQMLNIKPMSFQDGVRATLDAEAS